MVTYPMPTKTNSAARPGVRRHPGGGYTHAVPTGAGSCRIYRGWWPTHLIARRALVGGAP